MHIYNRKFERSFLRLLREDDRYLEECFWEGVLNGFIVDSKTGDFGGLINMYEAGNFIRRFRLVHAYFTRIRTYINLEKKGGLLTYIEIDERKREVRDFVFGSWVISFFISWKSFWDIFTVFIAVLYYKEKYKTDKEERITNKLIDAIYFDDRFRCRYTPLLKAVFKDRLDIQNKEGVFRKCCGFRNEIIHGYFDSLYFSGYPLSNVRIGGKHSDYVDGRFKDLFDIDIREYKRIQLSDNEFVDSDSVLSLIDDAFNQIKEVLDFVHEKNGG